MLRNALEDEIETIDRYVLRRRQAEALGHYGLAVELDDLIRDESTHRDEIQMILKRWDTGQYPGPLLHGAGIPSPSRTINKALSRERRLAWHPVVWRT